MLTRAFFQRPPTVVARELLGAVLVRRIGRTRTSGVVVETEAYGGSRDPASHAYKGKTLRNSVMFGRAGHAYVYFTMGMHFCLNVTAGTSGIPGAVLLRALDPKEGVRSMMDRRGIDERERLARGPGNLARAMGVDRSLNGEDMTNSRVLYLVKGMKQGRVGTSPRIGVTRARSRPWRFYLMGNPSVSGSRREGRNPRTHN
jgi:DNA-3-methyladenine glycosylase